MFNLSAGREAAQHRVFVRDGFACRCCGTSRDLTTHHLVQERLHRQDDPQTMIVACRGCARALEAAAIPVPVMPWSQQDHDREPLPF
jgi:hypothetical protein